MSLALERARGRIEAILRRFPSEEAIFTRPALDGYNQPTGAVTALVSCEVWRLSQKIPEDVSLDEKATVYEGNGMFWVCAMHVPALEVVEHGDMCELSGKRYAVRNILNQRGVRIFWQLEGV